MLMVIYRYECKTERDPLVKESDDPTNQLESCRHQEGPS